MQVRVKFFAALKEALKQQELELELAEGISCHEVLLLLINRHGELKSLFENSLLAVNGQYAERHWFLQAHDELAILPPVSGG